MNARRPHRTGAALALLRRFGIGAALALVGRPGIGAALALAGCLGIGAGAAWAGDEDGGVRSVFALGAGNRALGMGGAYAGIADDASAPMWNPGGLGFVQRRGVEASHATFYGLGFAEQSMALVVPSWRWGVAGVTFRHFGVDGIDVRDSRNLVLDENASDSESQLAISYGRPIGSAYSLGGTIKWQRQSLIGLSDSGLGLDLGLMVRPGLALGTRAAWTQRISVGMAMRNVLEPTIRLQQDAVSDPAAMRVGVAYWCRIGRLLPALLAAVDVEKTRDMHAGLHAGLEAQLHPMMSVRAGVNDGMLTAGTGIRWHDTSFDYAFENNRVGHVHRLGASFRFGATVAESRQAAREAEEEALERRVAEAFAKRQTERIDRLLARADSACAAKRYDEAVEILANVAVLEPANARARALEAACLRAKARQLEAQGEFAAAALVHARVLELAPDDAAAATGARRCRDESDRRAARSAKICQQMAAALDAFGAENFAAAHGGFARILADNPGDTEAAAMLRRTQQAIERRTANLLLQAERLVHGGKHAEAAVLAEQVRALDPHARGLAELQARIDAAALEARLQAHPLEDTAPADAASAGAGSGRSNAARHGATAGATSVSKEHERDIEDFYKRGMVAMEEGRTDDALRYWQFVWEANPAYQRVGEYLKREHLTRGMEEFARGNLAAAIRVWEQALRVDPTDERTIGYLERAQAQLSRTREILGGGK